MKKLFKLIRQGNLEEVKRILDKKPGLVACTATAPPRKDDGQSPLMVAIKGDQPEVAHLLLDYGADVNFVNGPSPLESYDIFAPVWYHAVGQCLMQARHSYSGVEKVRTEKYFALLCRLLDMGMDINREMTFARRFFYPKNAWREALEQYDYFAHQDYGSYAQEIHKRENEQLRYWLSRVLAVLADHGAFIYNFHVDDQYKYNHLDRIIRNLVFNRDIRDSVHLITEQKTDSQWFEIKWQPIDSILRPYYAKDNPYYGADVSPERKLFFENLAQGEEKADC